MRIKFKKYLSFLLMAVLLTASFSFTVIPAGAAGDLVNFYNSSTAPMFSTYPFHLMSEYIDVKEGDVLYFGPSISSQGVEIGVCNDKTEFSDYYSSDKFTVVSQLPNGEMIYKFTIPSGVSRVRAINNAANNSVYLITKNQPFDKDSFITYWSGKGIDANYYVNGAVNPTAVDSIVNKYDIKNPKSGYYDENGSLVSDSDKHYTTDFIPVKENDIVYIGTVTTTPEILIAGYNSQKGKVTGVLTTKGCAITEVVDSTAIFSYKVPTGVSYVTVPVTGDLRSTALVTVNQPFNAEVYKAYLNKQSGINDTIHTDSNLYGKSALFCGDSICAASVHDKTDLPITGWAGRIGHYYGMTAANLGKDGASVSTCRGDNRIITQINSAKNYKYDYIILHGGVNDAMDRAEVGTIASSFDVSSFNTATFAGGLEELFYYTKTYFETSKIGYIINFQTPNSGWGGYTRDMSKYFNIAKQICDKWGIPYLDLYNDADFNQNQMKVTTNENLADYLHPNTNGYNILYSKIATWMETGLVYMTNIKLSGKFALGFTDNLTVADVMRGIDDNTVSFKDANGNALTGGAPVATGCVFRYKGTDYTIVIKGDVYGDGKVDSMDCLLVKKACIKNVTLTEAQQMAACVGEDSVPSSIDYLKVKRHILGNLMLYYSHPDLGFNITID